MSWGTRLAGFFGNTAFPGLGYLLIGEVFKKAILAQIVFLVLFFSGIGIPFAIGYAILIGFDGYSIAKENEKESEE